MMLSKVFLHPFAGIQEKTFKFEDGLNVLLGPNEAGKSTVFQAVMHGLLTTTSLTRTKVGNIMGNHFPAVGGDVIRVDLELRNGENNIIRIHKIWKKGNRNGRASLKLPDGSEITDEEEVQNQIESLLPVSPATLRTILLADQSGLHRTMQEMKQEGKVRKELGNILRRNFMETGGVSVDRFRELLDQKYEDYFKRWNRPQQYPENNRGIKNPYKVGTGKVVEAYYKKEQLRLDLEEARRFEDNLDSLNEILNALIAQQEEKKEKFERLNPLKKGIRERQLKEQKLASAQERKERLLHVSKKWPVFEDKMENLEPKLEARRKKLKELQQEQENAKKKQDAEKLKQRIAKVEELASQVKEAKSELKEAQKVTQGDLKKLRSLQSDKRQLQTKIEAAKLTVRIESDSDRMLRYTEAGQDEQEIETKSGETLEQTASGGFTLITDELMVKVFSGEGDLEGTIETLQMKKEELSNYLTGLETESVQEAESCAGLYQKKENDLEQAKKAYKNELGDQKLEDLKNELEAFGDLSGMRSSEEITEDIVETRTALNQLQKEAEEAESKIKEWTEKYGSSDDVILELADTSKLLRDLQGDLDDLPSLPEGYESSGEFIKEVEQLDNDIQQLKEQVFAKKQERTQLEAEAPDTSSEELQKLREEAEAEFERINSRAETLAQVRKKSLELIETMDSDTYKGLESSFVKWLELMVGDRFSTVDMDSDMPTVFKTQEATSLTYNLLSHGTKDTVALAWRFTLCQKFLEGGSGFMILDDPMVDIDPKRRKAVVQAINEFSEQYQTIVMTCHPDHAEELNGEDLVM
ncbi:DNA repair exonuclease SbcCD ATPase subunit [Fodinibius roseus]|uniref:DNA repair exonuclease SbcCD ATPase subunit n=1 Tax=Fodinibius roseus TaxID=1194090 RepID=A0A1M5IVC8_9BACT|nr:AAA family ATPase [Fodinibius roseus]SHG31733.1 DNA repair exonuclease SbcCD ATPase subunit [Fodinibius roseus]